MKKIVMVLVMVGLLLSLGKVAMAGFNEAEVLWQAQKFVEAEIEFRKSLPTLTGELAGIAQCHIGFCLTQQWKYDAAISELEKVESIVGRTSYWFATARYSIGLCLQDQKKYDEALVEYANVKDNLKNVVGITADILAGIQFNTGEILTAQDKSFEAQEAYKSILVIRDAPIDLLVLAIKRINFVIMGQDGADTLLIQAYRTFIPTEVATTKKGLDYLSVLYRIMSAKAQALIMRPELLTK